MLAYVYGVVPISLCRSGGCGVSAGNGKGVRIEFDDENDNIGSGAAATGEHLLTAAFLLWWSQEHAEIIQQEAQLQLQISFLVPRWKFVFYSGETQS